MQRSGGVTIATVTKIMKIHTKIIATTILIAGLGSGSYYTYNEFNKLEDKNRKLIGQVNELSDEIVNKDKLISSYKEEVNLLEVNEKKLNEQVKNQSEEIEVLNKTIENKNTSIHNLKQQLEKATKRNESPRTVSRGASSNNIGEMYDVTAYHSGYESTGKNRGDKGYGITASGTVVAEGRTIACPQELPFGTKVHIDTVGYRICEDRGSAVKGKVLDLYIANKDAAWEFGRKKLYVRIIN